MHRASVGKLIAPFVIVLAGWLAYRGSLDGAFVLDDDKHIINNARIRSIGWGTVAGRRPLVDLSLALQYESATRSGQTEARAFHLFNLGVHLLAALTLFGVTRRTLEIAAKSGRDFACVRTVADLETPRGLPTSRNFKTSAARWLALATALIWVVHPLNTASVTYLIQRAESMMALCYLLVLYCVARSATSRCAVVWHLCAIAACAVGMGTKGVMVTAPVAVLLYDRAFLARSIGKAIRCRWVLYVGLVATWGVLVMIGLIGGVFSTATKAATVGFSLQTVSPFEYLITQPGVLMHYLTLVVWPAPLVLDYDWPIANTIGAVVAPGMIVLAMLAVLVSAWRRCPSVAFAPLFALLVLAPTSSIIPIKDALFEHRMYLPLAAIVAMSVVAAYLVLRRVILLVGIRRSTQLRTGVRSVDRCSSGAEYACAVDLPRELPASRDFKASAARYGAGNAALGITSTILAAAVVITLTVETTRRNRDYRSGLNMWRDVVAKRPVHGRAYLGLGTALFSRATAQPIQSGPFSAKSAAEKDSLLREAKDAFLLSVKYRPGHPDGYFNLGNVLYELKEHAAAIEAFEHAVKLNPGYVQAQYNLANTYKRLRRYDEAVASYRRAIKANPRHVSAYVNMGNALKEHGRLDEAIEAYHEVLKINPNHANAHYNLGDAHRLAGRNSKAMAEFKTALRLDPDHKYAARAIEVLRQLDN